MSMRVTLNIITCLDTEVRGSLTDKTEWSPDMNLHNNVESVVWRGVDHLVERKAGVVHDVINLAPFSI